MLLAAGGGETADLFVELGLVIGGLALLGTVASRAAMSPIPLYLLAGLAFGEGGLLPLENVREFVDVGAEIGVVLLLLTLGLEYSAHELTRSMRQNARAGVLDGVLNALPGALAGMLLGLEPAAWLALAGVTWISSSGIVARLLEDLGRVGNRETPVVLSILVFEDLAMAVYLPILVAVLAGTSPAGAAASVVLAVVVLVVVLGGSLKYGERLSRAVFSHDDELMLLRVLGITIMVAGVAQWAGVSTAVGAFLVGIALSGDAASSSRGLISPLRDLFAAVFFVTVGLRADPAEVWPAMPAALALAAVTIVTKFVTGVWAARRAGVGPRGRVRAGAVLVARGEFSIVIAGLAVTADVEGVGPLATAYVLILASAGPLVTRYAESLAAPLLRRWSASPQQRPS